MSLMQTNVQLLSERKALESTEFAEFKRQYMETQRKKTEFFDKFVKESTLSEEAKGVHGKFRDFLSTNFRGYDSLPESPDVDVKEYLGRLKTFAETMKKIDERNAHEQNTNTHPNPAIHGVTKYADWSESEFRALLGHKKSRKTALEESSATAGAAEKPKDPSLLQKSAKCTKNWASRTDMRNQGTCGSCWTFSTATTLRAAFIQQNGYDPGKLSTQFIVDCMKRTNCGDGVNGCCGGDVGEAMEWITAQGGIPTQKAYGDYYTTTTLLQADANASRAQGGPVSPGLGITFSGNHPTTSFPCKKGIPKKVTLTKKPVKLKTESDMADYLCNTGVFAVAVDANLWQTYKGGVMKASSCGTSLDHAVNVIGMDQAQNAWIIQNQWGADWGVSIDGKAPPKDIWSNCHALAQNNGCHDPNNAWIGSDCALSCSKSVADGGYIYMQYGENTCGVAGEAIAATSTKDVNPPKDKWSNCPALAKSPGCHDSLNPWIGPDCALSCTPTAK